MRVSQSMLDQAIETLNEVSKAKVKPRNCYGYYQLSHAKTGNDIFSTNGCSKAELYYQMQFYLRMRELEEAEN